MEALVSEHKLTANRLNAKLSTGPKDTTATRYNAVKHGLLSKAAIISQGEAKENPRELNAVMEALRDDFQPVGAMEEILVERIAVCYWRLRRAQKAEVGEIRKAADNAMLDAMIATIEGFREARDLEDLGLRMSGEGSRPAMATSSFGIQHIRTVLEDARALIEDQGFLTKDQLKEVAKVYGLREGTLAFWLSLFSSMAIDGPQAREKDPDKWADLPTPETCKEIMLKYVEEEFKKLDAAAEVVSEREKLEGQAALLAHHLPTPDAMEKIIRYETTIERQVYRAIEALKSLQAARLGGTVKRRLVIGMEEEG